MIANGQETFFLEMNKHVCNYTMYFPMIFDNKFDLSIYKKSVDHLLNQIPHLKRKCKDHFWRASWVPIKDFFIDQIFYIEEIDGIEKETRKEFYSRAIEILYLMKDKVIDLEKEPPLKFKVIMTEDRRWTMVVLCVHHSVADGRGSMQIMSEIGDIYTSLVNNQKLPIIKNYRKIPYRFLKESLFKILIRTFTTKENVLAAENTIDLTDCSKDLSKDENFISIEISKEKIMKLKAAYKEWSYTTNDIIVYLLLLICSDLVDGKDVNDSTVFNVGIAIDNRKNIKKEISTITNYASMCPFYIRHNTLMDKAKVKEELQNFKSTATGLSFSKEFMLMSLFPYAIQKKVFGGNIKNMIKGISCKGIQTTNVGELTKFVGNYNHTLKYAEFIGPAGKYGMPILSISLYEGDMRIYFRRTDDSNCLCNQLRDLLKMKLNDIDSMV